MNNNIATKLQKTLDTQICLHSHNKIKILKQPNFFNSQPSTLPNDAPAKFYRSMAFGFCFTIKLCSPLTDRRLFKHT